MLCIFLPEFLNAYAVLGGLLIDYNCIHTSYVVSLIKEETHAHGKDRKEYKLKVISLHFKHADLYSEAPVQWNLSSRT